MNNFGNGISGGVPVVKRTSSAMDTRGIPRRSRHLRRYVNSIRCRLGPVRRFTRSSAGKP